MLIRIFNYNTLEKVHSIEAHTDYIRSLAVHPTQPLLLSCGDDMVIKLWNWDNKWACAQVFEGHSHYVMQAIFNPKDTNTFASVSVDRSIKVWQLGANFPYFTLTGHEKGVISIDYFQGGDKPYLISGGDDRLIKIWDYQVRIYSLFFQPNAVFYFFYIFLAYCHQIVNVPFFFGMLSVVMCG